MIWLYFDILKSFLCQPNVLLVLLIIAGNFIIIIFFLSINFQRNLNYLLNLAFFLFFLISIEIHTRKSKI